MTLRRALDDYKRRRDDARRFPGERRSTEGTFSGLDDRLVYVDRRGHHRDYTYALSGLSGVERSRFGVRTLDGTAWFDEFEPRSQGYRGETALVETVLDGGDLRVTQSDLTVGRLHCTNFAVEGNVPEEPTLEAFFDLSPGTAEGRLGKLEHDDAVEVHHDRQANFVTASTGIDAVHGQLPEQFGELASYHETVSFPRKNSGGEKYEDALLNGTVVVEVPLDDAGDGPATATVVSLLADLEHTDRSDALARLGEAADTYEGTESLAAAAAEQSVAVPEGTPRRDLAVADLRVLSLLAAETGAHVAGPEIDPFYTYSGGYGYTWFRDDSEIAGYLLAADRRLDLGLTFDDSVSFYLDTQLSDGSWPHRVWAHSGRLAPGWAHARLEAGDDVDYQADQTASVATFLATLLRVGDPDAPGDVEEALALAVDALDDALAADGLPVACQNAWENMTGRFLHTAATFLEAYAAVARAPVGEPLRERALAGAGAVFEGLDDLWVDDRGIFALRERPGGGLDPRLDSGSLALAAAHREYAAVDTVGRRRRSRLVEHFETTLDGLFRETDEVAGLVRFEGDEWRRRVQDDEKIWTVATAWGAGACAELAELLDGAEAAGFYERSRSLLALVDADGPLSRPNGYLPEQVFDDGTPDCATPLGWPHAIRLATVARLADAGELA